MLLAKILAWIHWLSRWQWDTFINLWSLFAKQNCYIVSLGMSQSPFFSHYINICIFLFRETTLQIVSRDLQISYWVLIYFYVSFLIYFFVYLEGGERFKLKFWLSFHFQKFELNLKVLWSVFIKYSYVFSFSKIWL